MTIRLPTWTADPLRALGIGVVPLATNHALDHGTGGLPSSPDALDLAGVRHAGGRTLAEADAGVAVEAAGERLAVPGFCATLPPGADATASRFGAFRQVPPPTVDTPRPAPLTCRYSIRCALMRYT